MISNRSFTAIVPRLSLLALLAQFSVARTLEVEAQQFFTDETVFMAALARQRGLRIWWDASAAVLEGNAEGVELADSLSAV